MVLDVKKNILVGIFGIIFFEMKYFINCYS